ncbi:hypothetical protein M0Q28_00975 [Patescibacteria group bacterium]|jgi:hypothetical protein|nr:hypothetical protein [Patescibacteria group bacterium]
MLLHLCELLVIVVLLALLAFRRTKGPAPFHGNGFKADTYRESLHSQLQLAHGRVRELENSLGEMRERARQRNYIIYRLWRRNLTDMVLVFAWSLHLRFWRAVIAIWPSEPTRRIMVTTVLASAVMGGVLNAAPHVHEPYTVTPVRHAREPTMIPIQVTWGGEVVAGETSDPWFSEWQCHRDSRLLLVAFHDDVVTTCQILPDLAATTPFVPPFLLRDEREWLAWIYLAQPQYTSITIVLD